MYENIKITKEEMLLRGFLTIFLADWTNWMTRKLHT